MNNLIQLLMSGGNPQVILQQMMNNNPQARALVNQIQQSGMTPTEFLNQYAKQNRIDLSPYKSALGRKGVNI